MTEISGFEDAVKRIDEIAESLANGTAKSKGKATIELRGLCGRHLTVPSIYRLEGVVKEGDYAQDNTPVTETWKGRYKGNEVALKVFRVDRSETGLLERMKKLFCQEVVLMKQTNHDNIRPFHGVSSDVSDFCLVFPWYKNGNIMKYLKENPDINRYQLLSGAALGLRFLHENGLVHGALRPSDLLIDDNGNARLSYAGHSSMTAVPGTSTAHQPPTRRDMPIDDFRYVAPEVQWPEDYGLVAVPITKEGDMYAFAMVIYEVRTEKKPYYRCNDSNVLLKVQAGEVPERPSRGLDDLAWELLEECWRRAPTERPSAARVYETLLELSSGPQEKYTSQGPLTEELPGRLKWDFQSIKFSLDQPKQQQFLVKLKYGNTDHTTSPTNVTERPGEYKWNKPEIWVMETNKQNHGQLVTLEVFLRGGLFRGGLFTKDKVWATGNFSLFNNVNGETAVKLATELDGVGPIVLKIRLFKN